MVLECVVEAVPEASLTWLQGDQLISTCPDMELLNVSSACVPPDTPTLLVIQAASAESEGQYACHADNVAGSILHEVTVTVLPPETGECCKILGKKF